MSTSGDLIDFDIIESQKENIQSLPGGRSARALASMFSPSPLHKLMTPTPSDSRNLNDAMRQEYELELENIAESDDPLDIYDRYVKWTLDAYPSAQATPTSQLLPLLERATKAFQTSAQYKNDPRYLKMWLSYIRFFSDTPRETFAFLARHNIGEGLALFYEEFAAWLEGAERWVQAEEVYQLGIEKEARPAPRLLRKYNEFQHRFAQRPADTNEPSSPALPTVRPALAAKIDPYAALIPRDPQAPQPNAGVGGSTTKSGRQKLAIFSDADSVAPAIGGSEGPRGWDSIGSLADRKKENMMEARPWAGETLKAGGKKSSTKMAVFKDESQSQYAYPQVTKPAQHQVTVNQKGRTERIHVILEAVYPTPDIVGSELSLEELRAGQRGWLSKVWQSEMPKKPAPRDIHIFKDENEDPKLNSMKSIPVSKDERQGLKTKKSIPIFKDDYEESKVSKTIPIFKDENEESKVDEIIREVSEKLTIAREDLGFDENGAKKEPREGKARKMKLKEVNETQIIKAKLSSPSGPKMTKRNKKEQTMTLHTRAATDDIYDLFNQPRKAPQEEEEDEEESSDDEDDMTDGDYTSGGESTGTGRLTTTSEAGDDDETSDVKSVSEWSEFTARKHVPGIDDDDDDDTRASKFTDADNEDFEMVEIEAPQDVEGEQELSTPISPEPPYIARTSFVPIPPEDYEPPTWPYRDAAQVSQNRLPFMTPIAEKTESSLGLPTMRQDKDYFGSSKTPSKENGPKKPPVRLIEGLNSSPFREIINEAVPIGRIAQPLLAKNPKASKTALAARAQPLAREIIPKGPIIKDAQCNPVDDYTRNAIFAALQPPIETYDGFFGHQEEIRNKAGEVRKFAKAASKLHKGGDKTMTSTSPPILKFPGAERQYTVRRELGAGAFAPVILLENASENEQQSESGARPGKTQGRKRLEALKMEDPPTAWEFYILRQAKRRLGVSRAAESVIDVYEMHLYADECYLIEEYRDQGTLLDIINLARAEPTASGPGVMDECLVMFFTIELFRTVEALHAKGILHGDLKADNCLARFDAVPDDEVWGSRYRKDGSGGWGKKGVALIDFGRGIDMKVFRPDVQFIADWKTTPQDCAEMRELRPWTYQIDYHGLAGIIHSMLFGKYIDTVGTNIGGATGKKSWKIKESLKRYWQTEIWAKVFDLLLNPTAHVAAEEEGRLPVTRGMREVREGMEGWLEGNCEKGIGLQGQLRKLEAGILGRKR